MTRRHFWRRFAVAAAMATLSLACGAQTATNQQSGNEPGITKDTIKIGATFPVSGTATAYYSVFKGAYAYFQYVNSKGGVAGNRKIDYVVRDDQYLPANTPAKARELVEQEQVFMTYGDLGTPTNLAVRDYYNSQKVPQLFVFTGSDHWGQDYDKYPYTLGWQPDYEAESIIYAKYILKNEASDKFGILYQNDDYGKDYYNGFKKGLGDKFSSMVVKEATYNAGDPPDMSSQVNTLKASGANAFYVVATPAYAANAVQAAIKSGWNPKLYMNNVAGSTSTWRQVAKALGSSTPINGMITTSYLKDPLDTTTYGNDSGVQQFKQVMTQYGNGCPADGSDAFCIAGMASAYTVVDVLNKAYKDGKLTRKHVMEVACCQLHEKDNPLLLQGIIVETTKSDHFPIRQEKLQKWQDDHWVVFGDLVDAREGGTK
jgi:branched-chain amino acid transport system substrate-binding protein